MCFVLTFLHMFVCWQLIHCLHMTVTLRSSLPVISALSSMILHKCGWSISIFPGVATVNGLLLFTAHWPPALKATVTYDLVVIC